MRMILSILLFYLSSPIIAQKAFPDFAAIDKKIMTIDDNDPAALAQKLTASCRTDLEKVRAVFRWITEHIAYHRNAPPSRSKQKKLTGFTNAELEDTAALKPLTERVAIKVLQDRKAVCEGYARLFKSLCDHAGIPAAIITGYANNGGPGERARFRSNHSWNAVQIEGQWHLLDVTWASGAILYPTGEFLKFYDDYYFLAPPEKFIRHHYPDDLRWTLLVELPNIPEFRYSPFHQRSFVKYPVMDYAPATGIIEAELGDTIRLTLQTDPHARQWDIAPDSVWETLDSLNPMYAFVEPVGRAMQNRLYYQFPVTSDQIQWLHVMYNKDAILRYRLKIKKELTKKDGVVSMK